MHIRTFSQSSCCHPPRVSNVYTTNCATGLGVEQVKRQMCLTINRRVCIKETEKELGCTRSLEFLKLFSSNRRFLLFKLKMNVDFFSFLDTIAAEKRVQCSGSVKKSKSLSLFREREGGERGSSSSNPTGPHIAYGSSLRSGRSPSISPGTSSTRTTPGGGRGRRHVSQPAESFSRFVIIQQIITQQCQDLLAIFQSAPLKTQVHEEEPACGRRMTTWVRWKERSHTE